MKILVPLKRVVDYNVKVRPLPDNTNVDLNNVKMSVNPFCEIALEEAVRIKEAGNAEEVIAVTVGKSESQEQLRTALALGADRAILVETESLLEPLAIAKVISKVVEEENPDLIILGKQAIDGDNNQTGQMLGALLDYPQATNASEVMLDDSNVTVTREIDGGLQTLKLNKPAIVTTDLRLNEPRYASLPNIMKAKKKELTVKNVNDLGIDVSPRTYVKKHKENDIKKLGESNIFFGNVILENIQVMKVKKFINFSTVREGKNENKNMKNLYAAYKKSFGLILNFYKKKYPKIKFYELMLSDTFGENDKRPKIINTLKKNFYAGKITNVVSKNLYLNLLNVNDIVEAVNIILKKKVKPDKYVLKNTKYFNIFNLIQVFNKKNDKKIKVKWLSKRIIKNKIYNYKKLKNWHPYKSDIEDIINLIKI